MSDGGTPNNSPNFWFGVLRDDISTIRKEMREGLDKLVSSETFRQEQVRVNERFESIGSDITELNTKIASESTARIASETARNKKEAEEQETRRKEKNSRNWMIVGMFASPAAGIVITVVINSLFARIGVGP